jgi:anti-sigma factor RsiW
VTHLGQRLSALIDGELDGAERDQVLWHLVRCGWCQDEAAALRTLKRRMNALGEAAADAGLTGRLMGLSNTDPASVWPHSATAAWPLSAPAGPRLDAKAGRYLLAGSFAIFLAGLGTAAFIAGGDPQTQAPSAPVSPPVSVYTAVHDDMNGLYMDELMQPKTTQPGTGDSGRGQNRYSARP